jgi:16S rRNA (cytosine967-C5)-methyltransferase
MTPAARLSAAIEVLDAIFAGAQPDAALTAWGRASRFAGSGDRYGVRDIVFDALRCKRSNGALGGGVTGRGVVLGGLRAQGVPDTDIDALFCGQGHAPGVIGPADLPRAPTHNEALDAPDWVISVLDADLGAKHVDVLNALRNRAPVFLRVNRLRCDRAAAQAKLAQDGVETQFMQNIKNGLQVVAGNRKIIRSFAYLEGWVELQDAASQAVIEVIAMPKSGRILDYCAGGGGKTLSIASQCADLKEVSIFAHDAMPRRMADLPARANRAGAKIEIIDNVLLSAPYDLILTDVPCSGSGSWRRDPQGKWALTADRLNELVHIQANILDQAAAVLAQGGALAYATCSVLRRENEAQIDAFLARHPNWTCPTLQRFGLTDGSSGDGFFLAILKNGHKNIAATKA